MAGAGLRLDRRRDGDPVGPGDVPVRPPRAPGEMGHEVAEGHADREADGQEREDRARREPETPPLKELLHRPLDATEAQNPPLRRSELRRPAAVRRSHLRTIAPCPTNAKSRHIMAS